MSNVKKLLVRGEVHDQNGKLLSTYDIATQSVNGVMSSADKIKLDAIESGAQVNTITGVKGSAEEDYRTGRINISPLHIGLGNVDNTSDINKPVSTAQQTAIDTAKNEAKNEAIDYINENFKVSVMTGASSTDNGTSGLVPAPLKGEESRFFKGDGTYSVVTKSDVGLGNVDNTSDINKPVSTAQQTAIDTAKQNAISEAQNYTNTKFNEVLGEGASEALNTIGEISKAFEEHKEVTEAINAAIGNKVDKVDGKGLSTNDYTTTEKNKLAGIAEGANKYVHPTHSSKTTGLYKIAVDELGHISSATEVVKSDITGLGIPASDTTYGNASSTASGLMSADDKAKLDGIASGANKYTHPSYTSRASGLYKVTVDASGHVSAVAAVSKDDITALGIPSKDTTYSAATTEVAGLMSASDKTKLDGIASGANNYSHPTSAGNKHIPSGGEEGQILKWSANGTAAWASEKSYDDATSTVAGLMSASDKAKLNTIAENANYYVHPSHTAKSAGLYKVTIDDKGHVSAATAVAKSDITALGIPSTNTTYSAATTSTAGLMSTTDKTKLDGIAEGANKYTHPSYTAKASGFYKVTVDATGHVSAVSAVTKDDITGLGIPSTNTTYSAATTSVAGLMSAADKTKLDGIATGANKYSHPAYTSRAAGLYKITVDATGHVSAVTAVAKSDITALGIPSTNTTYSNMSAATSSAAGAAGLVPAPAAGAQSKFLRGDATWQSIAQFSRSIGTLTGNGSTKTFTYNHNKNSYGVITEVYDSSYNTVQADVKRTSTNAISVTFVTAPASGTTYYVAVV